MSAATPERRRAGGIPAMLAPAGRREHVGEGGPMVLGAAEDTPVEEVL